MCSGRSWQDREREIVSETSGKPSYGHWQAVCAEEWECMPGRSQIASSVFSLRSRLVASGCPCDASPHRTAPCRASEFLSPPPTGPFSLKSPASWGQAVARSRGHSCGGGPHRRPPFAERAPSTSQRATPLRTPGSESWCPTPSRDGHLIRAALVGIQPEVCRSATTGERRRAAINRGRWRDRSSLPPGRRLSRGRQALPSRWWSRGHAIAGDDLPRIVGRSRCDFASAR